MTRQYFLSICWCFVFAFLTVRPTCSAFSTISKLWRIQRRPLRIPAAKRVIDRSPCLGKTSALRLCSENSNASPTTTTSTSITSGRNEDALTNLHQDSLENFEHDCSVVLNQLFPHAVDPTIPQWFDPHRQLSFTNYWGLKEWERHYSRTRYIRHILQFPQSRLLRRLWPQMTLLALWTVCGATMDVFWKKSVSSSTAAAAPLFRVPLASLSLVSTFVAALQTLRSNQGLERLKEARLAMGRMILHTRDLSQLVSVYISPKDPQLGLRMARHLAIFGFLLKAHYRESLSDELVDLMLSPVDAAYIKTQRRRPVALVTRLRHFVQYAIQTGTITTTSEHTLLELNLQHLNDVIATGERIRGTPVPPVYSAHSTRLMVVFLLWLPFALLGSLSSFATFAVTMVVAFAMMGLDEMSHMFELPFRFMPLYHLSKLSLLDVADAFCRSPPPVTQQCIEKGSNRQSRRPLYWPLGKEQETDSEKRNLPYDGSSLTDEYLSLR